MDEYIKRDDAMKALDEYRLSHTMSMHGDVELLMEFRNGVVGAMNALAFVSAADVAPKSEGKWKPYKDYFTHRQIGWICTNCSAVTSDLSNGDTNYCPHCGAVMETESEEEDE